MKNENMNDFLFSIIIPHKDCQQLLYRCIKSIPEREDIQILVIDDNSSNKDFDFSSLGKRNIELFLLDKSRTAGGARNVGLDNANGKWILFSDADDFFHDNISIFLDKYVDNNSDLIVFNTDSVMSDTLQKVDNREVLVEKYKQHNDENILRYEHHGVWGKMFRKNFVTKNNIRFHEALAGNDMYFAAVAGYYAKKVLYVDDIIYCCTVRSGSLCTRININHVLPRIKEARETNRFFKNRVPVKYWTNLLGPVFSCLQVRKWLFVKEFFKYLSYTPLKRIIYDFIDSGGRWIQRLMGNVNDKDIKKLQSNH